MSAEQCNYSSESACNENDCFSGSLHCGEIEEPEDCRWIKAYDWNHELKCDGNEVAVGSCSGGSHFDCPENTVHQLKCCSMQDFYYSECDTYNSDYGIPIDCREHGDGSGLLEGQCASGANHDCHGYANLVTCCKGHYQSEAVGPVSSECTWQYSHTWGDLLECGRSDEVLTGRCGSGSHYDCPGETTQGILCCQLDFI